jgi:hypothetical protein
MIEYTVKVVKGGTRMWFLNGKRHREDGPAVEHPDGYKEWRFNGKVHREDGPAIEYASGKEEWWRHGCYMSEEEHRAGYPFVALCAGKIVEIDGKKYKLTEV